MVDNDLLDLQSSHQTRTASEDGARWNGAQRAEKNRLLRILSSQDYAWISSHLEPVPMKLNDVLAAPNEPFRHVYFPETAVVSVVNQLSGGTVEVGTVGNEGIAGLSALLDAEASPSRTFVQVPGDGKRIDARIFAEGVEARRDMRRVFRRYTHAFLAQVSQSAACNGTHDIYERCARWLLMTHDRLSGADSFPLTHEALSYMLGVRRAGVTVAAGALQKAGLIRYARGRVTVLDRAGLEAASCECYHVVKSHFDRLLGDGKPSGSSDQR